MVVSAALLEALLQARFFNFKSFYWARCKQLLLITLLYSLNAALALFGLKTLNVPMYTTLKRLTPFIILIVKVFDTFEQPQNHVSLQNPFSLQAVTVRKWPPLQVSASVLVVVAGCLIAGMGDLTFEVWGYVMALASCVAQAGYLLLVEFQTHEAWGLPSRCRTLKPATVPRCMGGSGDSVEPLRNGCDALHTWVSHMGMGHTTQEQTYAMGCNIEARNVHPCRNCFQFTSTGPQGAGGIPTSELLYYTAWSSLPMLASLAIISGEASMVRPVFTLAVQTHGHIPVASTIGSCCALGCALNYALFLCTTNNSALTTTIVGVLKSVVAVVLGEATAFGRVYQLSFQLMHMNCATTQPGTLKLCVSLQHRRSSTKIPANSTSCAGFFLLGGVPFSMINVMGISLNLVGGIWYTAYKFREKSSTTRAVAASLSNDALKNASLPQVAKQPDHIMSPGTQTAPGSSKILERSLDDQMPPLPRSTARDILMGVHTAREKYPI
eukprot:351893-Chlamydomonas_euryale.AAC.3